MFAINVEKYLIINQTIQNIQNVKIHVKEIQQAIKNNSKIDQTNIIDDNLHIENGEIIIIDGKYKCYYCTLFFDNLDLLDRHCKLECKCNRFYNNIYKFDDTKLANHLFNTDYCGQVYIIRNNFDIDNNIFKIGITSDLSMRIRQYRCGTVNEPALLYYFPCKDVHAADKLIKVNLLNYNIKREIYEGNLNELKTIIQESLKSVNDGKIYCYEAEFKRKDIMECIGCKKIFSLKSNLENHFKNCKKFNEHIKNIDTKDWKCNYCHKILSTSSNYNRHISNFCKIKKQQDNAKEDLLQKLIEEMSEMKEIIKQNNDKINKLESENKKYVQKINKQENNIQTHNTKIDNQQNIQVNNIKLLAFGKEDMSHLVDEVCKKILNKGFKSVPTLVEHVHFNKNKPEKHNIYISNIQSNYALVYDGNDWKLREEIMFCSN